MTVLARVDLDCYVCVHPVGLELKQTLIGSRYCAASLYFFIVVDHMPCLTVTLLVIHTDTCA